MPNVESANIVVVYRTFECQNPGQIIVVFSIVHQPIYMILGALCTKPITMGTLCVEQVQTDDGANPG